MRSKSFTAAGTTLLLALSAVGLVVSLVGYGRTARHPGIHLGAVALGSAVAALVAAVVTTAVVFVSRRRWVAQESQRLERAAARLSESDTRTELKYVPRTLDRLLNAAVTDSANELGVHPQSLTAQILLLLGQHDKESEEAQKEFTWPEVPVGHSGRLSSAARRAVEKNTPVAILPEPEAAAQPGQTDPTLRWVISVPVPSTQNAPPLGAITVSGTNEDVSKLPKLKDLESVVSLLLSWARLAALQIGVPSPTGPDLEGQDNGD